MYSANLILFWRQGKSRLGPSIFCHIPDEVRQRNRDKVDKQANFSQQFYNSNAMIYLSIIVMLSSICWLFDFPDNISAPYAVCEKMRKQIYKKQGWMLPFSRILPTLHLGRPWSEKLRLCRVSRPANKQHEAWRAEPEKINVVILTKVEENCEVIVI